MSTRKDSTITETESTETVTTTTFDGNTRLVTVVVTKKTASFCLEQKIDNETITISTTRTRFPVAQKRLPETSINPPAKKTHVDKDVQVFKDVSKRKLHFPGS